VDNWLQKLRIEVLELLMKQITCTSLNPEVLARMLKILNKDNESNAVVASKIINDLFKQHSTGNNNLTKGKSFEINQIIELITILKT
jgi:hypothetical protein